MKVFNRKSAAAAAVPEVPTPADIQRLTIAAIQVTQSLRRKRTELRNAQQDRQSAESALEKQAAAATVEMFASEVASLEAEKQLAELAVKKAENAARIPEVERMLAAVDPLLKRYSAVVVQLDKHNHALAQDLTEINEIAEQLHKLTAGRSTSVMDRMGSLWHPVELRARFYNSLPLCWPSWLRFKFQNSYARSIPDKKTLLEYEELAQKRTRERLSTLLKSLKEEIENV